MGQLEDAIAMWGWAKSQQTFASHGARDILEYLALGEQLDHLVPAVACWAEPSCISHLEPPGQHLPAPDHTRPITHEPVTDKMYLLRLVLSNQLQARFPCPPSPPGDSCHATTSAPNQPGLQVLHWMGAQLGFLEPAARQPDSSSFARSLVAFLTCSSLGHMHKARDWCVAALCASIRPANCFGILGLARSCKHPGLESAARACALHHFPEALDSDVQAFQSLPTDQLVSLLSDNNLKVPSESSVFIALMTWCQSRDTVTPIAADVDTTASGSSTSLEAPPQPASPPSPAAPQPMQIEAVEAVSLAALSQRCVRPGLMSISELEVLDGSQEVSRNEEALRLVAGWYIGCLFHSLPQTAYAPRTTLPVS